MKETKLKRLIKKMMDSIFLDAMTPEFKAANSELLKAIKMNDKSGAVPHADLEAVNNAMKANDAEKAGAELKKVQLQFSKAEKKLDDDVKTIQAKLETTKKAAETAKASLKQKKVLASVFDKLKTLASGLSNNPKSASKLTALTDKVKDYGDLSKRASQIITLVSSNKDASKQIDMLKKSVDVAEKKFKKDLANIEKESKKADDALEVAKMQVKITQGKKDAFTKERLYIANAVKQMPSGDLRHEREQKDSVTDKAIQILKTELEPELKKMVKEAKAFAENYEKEHKSAFDRTNRIRSLIDKFKERCEELLKYTDEFGSDSENAHLRKVLHSYANSLERPETLRDIGKYGGDNFLVSATRMKNRMNKAQLAVYESLESNLLYIINKIQDEVNSARSSLDFEVLLFVPKRNKLGKKTGYLQTREGEQFYQKCLEKVGNISHKIVRLFPNFDFSKIPNRGEFKYSYFDNPKPLLNAFMEAIKSSSARK